MPQDAVQREEILMQLAWFWQAAASHLYTMFSPTAEGDRGNCPLVRLLNDWDVHVLLHRRDWHVNNMFHLGAQTLEPNRLLINAGMLRPGTSLPRWFEAGNNTKWLTTSS